MIQSITGEESVERDIFRQVTKRSIRSTTWEVRRLDGGC